MRDESRAGLMPEMFTPEWVEWLDIVLSECRAEGTARLVLEHRVTDDDGSMFCWHVRVGADGVSAAMGPAGEASTDARVTFASHRTTARAIAVEGTSAQRAFADGLIRLDGDPQLLIEARSTMSAIAAKLTEAARTPT